MSNGPKDPFANGTGFRQQAGASGSGRGYNIGQWGGGA